MDYMNLPSSLRGYAILNVFSLLPTPYYLLTGPLTAELGQVLIKVVTFFGFKLPFFHLTAGK
jgi:hypothetical protein